jgi:hypothetical protein
MALGVFNAFMASFVCGFGAACNPHALPFKYQRIRSSLPNQQRVVWIPSASSDQPADSHNFNGGWLMRIEWRRLLFY